MGGKLQVRHEFFDVGEVRLHAAVQEPASGARRGTIVMLHGFPEFWYCWKHQIPEFARDFRVVAPDLRGYNLSDKPEAVEAYRMPHLVGDVRGLIDALGEERVVLMAHDWGGALAWAFAASHAERLSHLIILNAPHPSLFMRDIVLQPGQQESSQYIHMLRSERAEDVLSRDDFKLMKKFIFSSMKTPYGVSAEDEAMYVEAWSRQGAIRGSTNWYRAMPAPPPDLSAQASSPGDSGSKDSSSPSSSLTPAQAAALARIPRIMIRVPTLVVWGMQDHALLPTLLEGLDEFVPDLTIVRIEEGTHWITSDCPDEVNRAVRAYLDARLG